MGVKPECMRTILFLYSLCLVRTGHISEAGSICRTPRVYPHTLQRRLQELDLGIFHRADAALVVRIVWILIAGTWVLTWS